MKEIFSEIKSTGFRSKIIGIGSKGIETINTLKLSNIPDTQFISIDSTMEDLVFSNADINLPLFGGTRGLGTLGDPEVAREITMQKQLDIEELLRDADMVVIATGLGGGTGTGATPVVAEIAKGMDIPTICFVTLPFFWEGRVKRKVALGGLEAIVKVTDAYIIMENDKLKKTCLNKNMIANGFMSDSILGLFDIFTPTTYLARDYADLVAMMRNAGWCAIGTGFGHGQKRASDAVAKVLSNPFLMDLPLETAKEMFVNLVCDGDFNIYESEMILHSLLETFQYDKEIKYGLCVDKDARDSIRVVVLGLGLAASYKASIYQ